MGKNRDWTQDAVRNIHNTVSQHFWDAWRQSGLPFGEFCDRLLGFAGWDPSLNTSIRIEEQLLERLGHEVEVAQTRLAAIQALKARKEREHEAFIDQVVKVKRK